MVGKRVAAFVLFLALLVCVGVMAAVPGKISYQGKLEDGGVPMNSNVDFRFAIYSVLSGGTPLWSEAQYTVPVMSGIYNVLLGDSVSIPTSVFSGSTTYLQVTVDGEILSPRQPLSSVPYAMKAQSVPDGAISNVMLAPNAVTSAKIQDGTITGADIGTDALGATQIQDIYVLNTGDTVSGNLGVTQNETIGQNLTVTGRIGIGATPDPNSSIINSYQTTDSFGAYLYGTAYGLAAVWKNDPSNHNVYLGSQQYGVKVYEGSGAQNDNIYGGYFESWSGLNSFGLYSTGNSSASSNSAYGIQAWGRNYSSSPAYGGYFAATADGTGNHYGIFAKANTYAGWFQDGRVHIGSAGTENFVDGNGDLYVQDELEVDGPARFTGGLNADDILSGTLNYARFSSYLELTDDGRLDNNADTDLLTRLQADNRYVNQWETWASNLSVTGDLTVTGGNIGLGTAPNYSYGIYNGVAPYPGTGAVLFGDTVGVTGCVSASCLNTGNLGGPDYGVYGIAGVSSDTQLRSGGRFGSESQGESRSVDGRAYGYGTGSAEGVYGFAQNQSSGKAYGGYFSTSNSGTGERYGVYGFADNTVSTAGNSYGGYFSAATNGAGSNYGIFAQSNTYPGHFQYSPSPASHYVDLARQGYGIVVSSGNSGEGVDRYGADIWATSNASAYGVHTHTTSTNAGAYAVDAQASNTGAGDAYAGRFEAIINGTGDHYGVNTKATSALGRYSYGLYSQATGTGGNYAVYGLANGTGTAINYGVYASASSGTTNWAGYFSGNVNVTGTLSKGGGSFKIDHPLDPENKYLYHSFVESPDMKNIYDGVVTLDTKGEALVKLPEWFEALNRDFRYQLTPIGAPGPNLFIAQEISGNQFQIAGGDPGMKVSWLVTGIRQDAFANANRIPVEQDKPADEKGKYLHPQAFGMDETLGVDYERNKEVQDKHK